MKKATNVTTCLRTQISSDDATCINCDICVQY